MNVPLVIALAVHVVAAVFWAGSTFTLARTAALGAERLFASQLSAAAVAILSGGYLWGVVHKGRFETSEKILAAGISAAIVALIVQAALGGSALPAIRRANGDNPAARSRVALAQRIAAGLLFITVVCMATARYA
jgi:Mg/Co/Ni transporter MgtE